MMEPVTFTPIGFVESPSPFEAPSLEMRLSPSRLVVRPELEAGLLGLEPGQDILVVFYCHRARGYQLQLHPRHDPTQPLKGVFATRSQYRPNAIGATVARIVARQGSVLTVTGLDAQDGSPLLDIKPYRTHFDTADAPEGEGYF